MIFPVDHPLWDVWKQKKKLKFLLLIRKKKYRTPKKSTYLAKKVRLGFRGFAPVFGKLTTPYVMFESKKKKKTQILLEFLDGTKKGQLAGKNSSARV